MLDVDCSRKCNKQRLVSLKLMKNEAIIVRAQILQADQTNEVLYYVSWIFMIHIVVLLSSAIFSESKKVNVMNVSRSTRSGRKDLQSQMLSRMSGNGS